MHLPFNILSSLLCLRDLCISLLKLFSVFCILFISWLQSPSAVILEPKKIKSCHCFHWFPINLPWSDGTRCHDLRFLNVELQARFFTLLFHFHQEALQFLFPFWNKGGVICISEVIDISPRNLDSSLCFIQSGILHDVFCIEVK